MDNITCVYIIYICNGILALCKINQGRKFNALLLTLRRDASFICSIIAFVFETTLPLSLNWATATANIAGGGGFGNEFDRYRWCPLFTL